MRRLNFSSFVCAALAAVLASYVIGFPDSPGGLPAAGSPGTHAACGLHGSSAEEAENLFGFEGSPTGGDVLVETAVARLEKDGWRPCRLVGYQAGDTDRPGPEEQVVILRAGDVFRFEPPPATGRLDPGVYWIRGEGRVWELLLPDACAATIRRADD